MPIIENLDNEIIKLDNWWGKLKREGSDPTYYMLLCKDISYYTIFIKKDCSYYPYPSLGAMILECIQDIGKPLSIDIRDNDIEIWVRTPEEENLCMYLFNCEKLIVPFSM